MKDGQINAPITNYYGTPTVWRNGDKYYFGIEDYDGMYDEIEVSEKFYEVFRGEFEGRW